MIIMIIFLILTVLFVIGTAFYLNSKKKNVNLPKHPTDSQNNNKTSKKGKKQLSDILQVKIKDNIICLGNRYSNVISLGNIDYNMLSNSEQDSIETVLIQTALSIDYPVQFFSTTEFIDTTKVVSLIKENKSNNIRINEYRNYLIEYLQNLMENKTISIVKNYAIISYDGAYDKAIEELNRRSLSFMSNLLRAKIVCEILQEDELYNLIYRELNKNSAININNFIQKGGKNLYVEKKQKIREINIFDNVPTIADILLPETLQERKDYLILGYNKYTRIFAMTIYPEQTWVSWLDDLFHIGNINISVKIEPSSNGNVINQLTKKLVQAQSEYATYSRQGNILHLPELEKQIVDLEELRMLIQTNQDKLFFATIFISLNAESLEELNEKTKILESELNKKTAMIRTLTFRQVEGLKTMLPIGEIPIPNYERNMVAGGIATLIPISNPNLSHDKGIFIGRNLYTNAPVYIDTFCRSSYSS